MQIFDPTYNLAQYVANSPTAFVDPLGLAQVTLDADAFIPDKWVSIPPDPGVKLLYPLATVDSYVKGDDRDVSPTPLRANKTRIHNWITFETCSCGPFYSSAAGINSSTRMDVVFQSPESDIQRGVSKTLYTSAMGTLEHTEKLASHMKCQKLGLISANGRVPFRVAKLPVGIDYDYYIITTHVGNTVSYSIFGTHDAFLGHEVYMSSGGRVIDKDLFTPSISSWTSWIEAPLKLAGFWSVDVSLEGSFTVPDYCCCGGCSPGGGHHGAYMVE